MAIGPAAGGGTSPASSVSVRLRAPGVTGAVWGSSRDRNTPATSAGLSGADTTSPAFSSRPDNSRTSSITVSSMDAPALLPRRNL